MGAAPIGSGVDVGVGSYVGPGVAASVCLGCSVAADEGAVTDCAGAHATHSINRVIRRARNRFILFRSFIS